MIFVTLGMVTLPPETPGTPDILVILVMLVPAAAGTYDCKDCRPSPPDCRDPINIFDEKNQQNSFEIL